MREMRAMRAKDDNAVKSEGWGVSKALQSLKKNSRGKIKGKK
jgi:hypothetical protein